MPYVPEDGVILSPAVEFFRGGSADGYPIRLAPVKVAAVLSVAMYNCNSSGRDAPPSDQAAYEVGVARKFKALIHAAIITGADVLIVPDIGCGVFGNDAATVGRIAGTAMQAHVGYFGKVVFTGKREFYDAVMTSLDVGQVAMDHGTPIIDLVQQKHNASKRKAPRDDAENLANRRNSPPLGAITSLLSAPPKKPRTATPT